MCDCPATDVDEIVFPAYRNQGASSLAWGTSDEKAFTAIAPRIVSALEGLPVNVDVASRLGWTLVGGEMDELSHTLSLTALGWGFRFPAASCLRTHHEDP